MQSNRQRIATAVLVVGAVAAAAGCLGGPAEYPPGVSADGVEDPGALIAAHEAALDGASYRVNATLTGDARGLPDRLIMEMRFGAAGSYHGRRLVQGGGRARVQEVWHAGGSDRMYVARLDSTDPSLDRNVTVATWNESVQPFTFTNFTRQELASAAGGGGGAVGDVAAEGDDVAVTIDRGDGTSLRLVVAPSGLIRHVVSESQRRTWTVTTERVDGVAEPRWVAAHRRSGAG